MDAPRTGPVFPGVHNLLKLIRDLYDRPCFLDRDPSREIRGEEPLPLICLQRETTSTEFLDALSQQLDAPTPTRVPHTFVDATTAAEKSRLRWSPTSTEDQGAQYQRDPPLLPILDELRFNLSADKFGTDRLRFDHYRLADSLTGLHVPQARRRDDRADLLRILQQWARGESLPTPNAVSDAVDHVPHVPTRLALRLLVWAGRVTRVRWLRERVPGLGREIRWFMRHQGFMVPRHSTSFLGFAERLTSERRSSENPDQVKKLLVHAFLQDLRVAYRRRRLKALAHRSGWRRTAYATVLLDNLTADNGGWELLRLINEVRNETGELDPLLIVAASDDPPPSTANGSLAPFDPGKADQALISWRRSLPRRRQKLASDARYLPIALPPPVADVRLNKLAREDQCAWEGSIDLTPRRAPRLARRGAMEWAVVGLLLFCFIPTAINLRTYWRDECSLLGDAISDGVSVRILDVAGDPQCIGHSDSRRQIFGTNQRLRHVQGLIFDQNEAAARFHEQNPDRPVVSIAYFAGLTHRGADPDTDDATAEELEGILVRQRQQNRTSKSEPLLRVVVANGGEKMTAAPAVAREMLVPLANGDQTIKAVVGLDRTVSETEEAIAVLGANGIPTVGTSLTGSGLSDDSPLYFQLVAGNAVQARLIAGYARSAAMRTVTIVHPPVDTGDTYVKTLVEALKIELANAGISRTDVGWRKTVDELKQPCADSANHSDEMTFYAGREDDFGDFLRRMTAACYDSQRLPLIVADDAVSRFVAQKKNRGDSSLARIPVSYVGMGSLVVLAGPSCLNGVPGPMPGGTPLSAFCAGYSGLLAEIRADLDGDEVPEMFWPGERVGLAYDAAGLFVEAVRDVRQRSELARRQDLWDRGALAQQLREPTFDFKGATGKISFDRSRVGEHRNLAILNIADIYDLKSNPTCVYLIGDLYDRDQERMGNGCPVYKLQS